MTARALWRLGAWAGAAVVLVALGLPAWVAFVVGKLLLLAGSSWAVGAYVAASALSEAWCSATAETQASMAS